MTEDEGAALDATLARQRARDLLGRDRPEVLRAHSLAFARAAGVVPAHAVDLGSGGGVPGLVLALEAWPAARLTLLDANQRRCTYLEVEVGELGLGARVEVLWQRAEEAGRDEVRRGRAQVVTARSFGAPAVTAECAAPLLAVGGVLVVSDPPDGAGGRWDVEGLARLGLEPDDTPQVDGVGFSRFRQVRPCPQPYPRRPGVPAKRPLF